MVTFYKSTGEELCSSILVGKMIKDYFNITSLLLLFILALSFFKSSEAFRAPLRNRATLIPLDAAVKLNIQKNEEAVGRELCRLLTEEYHSATSQKGSFVFAISGGSMLKMLSYLDAEIDWKRCTMGFVSHRCVPLHDDGATYKKALPIFLQEWKDKGLTVITVKGSDDSAYEAKQYESSLKKIDRDSLPYTEDSYPIFDLLLIGVGTDGHIGSIYPGLQEDVESKRVIVPATSSNGKISMSIKTMMSSKKCIVACAGKSLKAPLGKAEGIKRALVENETPLSFPASALRAKATWLLDNDSAVLLERTK